MGSLNPDGTGAVGAASGPEDANAASSANLGIPDRAGLPPQSLDTEPAPLNGGDRDSLAAQCLIDGADLLDRVSTFISRCGLGKSVVSVSKARYTNVPFSG